MIHPSRAVPFLCLEDQVAIVTGAARGIGAAIALALLEHGARVVAVDSDEHGLLQFVDSQTQDARDRLTAVALDITDEVRVQAAIDSVVIEHGRVDILINNAGVAQRAQLFWEIPTSEWDRIFAVDVFGLRNVVRAVVPTMVDRGYGRIVNVSSMAGKEGNPRSGAYSAAKAAVLAMTKSLGKELATTGVLVNAVTPAIIETPLVAAFSPERRAELLAQVPMGRLGRPDEVADLVLFLASARLSFSTGAVYDISGGRATY
jgi:NAD(P)-dependent dehydrogenase (short-subunit alcohol dehydrogenase family)